MSTHEKARFHPAPTALWLAAGALVTMGCGAAWPASATARGETRHVRVDVTRVSGDAKVTSSAAGEPLPGGASKRALTVRVADGCAASSEPGACEIARALVSGELGRAGFTVVHHPTYLAEKHAREEAAKRAKAATPIFRIGAKKEPPAPPPAPLPEIGTVVLIEAVRAAAVPETRQGERLEIGWADSRGSLAPSPGGVPREVQARVSEFVAHLAPRQTCRDRSAVRLAASAITAGEGRVVATYAGELAEAPEASRRSYLFAVRGADIAPVHPEGADPGAAVDEPPPCPGGNPGVSPGALRDLCRDLVAHLQRGGEK